MLPRNCSRGLVESNSTNFCPVAVKGVRVGLEMSWVLSGQIKKTQNAATSSAFPYFSLCSRASKR